MWMKTKSFDICCELRGENESGRKQNHSISFASLKGTVDVRSEGKRVIAIVIKIRIHNAWSAAIKSFYRMLPVDIQLSAQMPRVTHQERF